MADNIGRSGIAHDFKRRGELETRLTTMFAAERWELVANDFTEEGYGREAAQPLVLYYVQCDGVATHVGTWAKAKRKGWIFTSAYQLFKVAS